MFVPIEHIELLWGNGSYRTDMLFRSGPGLGPCRLIHRNNRKCEHSYVAITPAVGSAWNSMIFFGNYEEPNTANRYAVHNFNSNSPLYVILSKGQSLFAFSSIQQRYTIVIYEPRSE